MSELDDRAYRQFLDPRLLSTIEDLELVARGVVEGFQHGLHRSPYVGFSVEFSSHREYLPGDDLRHMDWKVYGRQDRLYIKQYDAETNLDLSLVMDASASMLTASTGVSKLRYAVMLAAALAHLGLSQRDAAGLTIYADRVLEHVRPRVHPDQLLELLFPLTRLDRHPAADSPRALHEVADLIPRRGLIVLIGDFFFEVSELAPCLEHLRHGGHEILLFHVLDPIEQRLPLDGPVKFTDLESGQQVVTQAHELRGHYRQVIAAWQDELRRCCAGHDIDYRPLVTDEPLDKALTAYLATRSEMY
jgi:uncharacterized protein (DUF58 family)